MSQRDRSTLKGFFNTNDVISETAMQDLIDSFLLVSEQLASYKAYPTLGAAELDLDASNLSDKDGVKVTNDPAANFDFGTGDVDTGTDRITESSHGLSEWDKITFTTTGTLPAGLSTGTDYYVLNPTTNDFQVASSIGGSAIDLTDSGSGTHTCDHENENGYYHVEGSSIVKDDTLYATTLAPADTSEAVTGKAVEDRLIETVRQLSSEKTPYVVVDDNNKVLFHVDENGEMELYPTASSKNRINHVEKTGDDNFEFSVVDANNKPFLLIDEVYEPAKNFNFINNAELKIKSLKLLNYNISLSSTAVGRESSEGADDAPTLTLDRGGYTHPSVVYIPGGFAGYSYWMAITPTFGITSDQSDATAYENPHIFCSTDGITWQEPTGISNPIDLPPASPSNGYWSDTELLFGDDGWLHLFYRGNSMPADFIDSNSYSRVVVHRKSRDGINWTARKVVYSTNDPNVNSANALLSPSMTIKGRYTSCIDIITSDSGGIEITGNSTNNQTNRFLFHRYSKDIDEGYENYNTNQVVNLINRPWGTSPDPWHVASKIVNDTYFLLINVGPLTGSTANKIYVAYSDDGFNFKVISKPLFTAKTYRSAFACTKEADDELKFYVYQATTDTGGINLYELILTK